MGAAPLRRRAPALPLRPRGPVSTHGARLRARWRHRALFGGRPRDVACGVRPGARGPLGGHAYGAPPGRFGRRARVRARRVARTIPPDLREPGQARLPPRAEPPDASRASPRRDDLHGATGGRRSCARLRDPIPHRRGRRVADQQLLTPTASAPGADLVEDGEQVRAELGGVLAHREVADLLHDRDARALDLLRGAARVLGRAGEVVLAGEEIERTGGRVDLPDAVAEVAVGAVEVEVALEDAGAALHVHPERVPARGGGGVRGGGAGQPRAPPPPPPPPAPP